MAIILSVVAAFLTGFGSSRSDHFFEISKHLDIFTKIVREVDLNYVDEIEPGPLIRTGIDAMLKSLDPYTNYISAAEIEEYRYMTDGQYGGIGANMENFNGRVIISEVYENRPAYNAGLRAGDHIIKVDNEIIEGKNFDNIDVRNLVRGQAGTEVKLTVRRFGQDKPLVFTVKREDIKIDNVPFFGMVEPGVGYVSLHQFTRGAAEELQKAIAELKKQDPNLQGLILDLRGNPGGLLHEAVAVSNFFVPKGEKIVETRGKVEGSYKRYDAENDPLDVNIPLAVLIDEKSASASEIVSGVVQDLDRGVIVGRQSFGKGLVQTTRPLSFKTQLKVTTARYYTPSGRCIQAVNYSHKTKDGAVVKTPDSLKQSFKTRAGRPVLDAGGILPDVPSESPPMRPITRELFKSHVLQDFVTQYYFSHPTPPPAESFAVDDALYQDFVKFVSQSRFKFESEYSKLLDTLLTKMKKDAYDPATIRQVETLQASIKNQTEKDLYHYKSEISKALKDEIIQRYYFRKGRIQAGFRDDADVKAAARILKDPVRYKKILSAP
ncbi:MAG: S41 family peptidase [Bacteroidia bacterium]|nr:S41 family peptidase [Bacteroidia bacterium]